MQNQQGFPMDGNPLMVKINFHESLPVHKAQDIASDIKTAKIRNAFVSVMESRFTPSFII